MRAAEKTVWGEYNSAYFQKMRNYYLVGIMLLCSLGVKAQNVINTDRPDQSDGTHIVEKHHFQIETGIQLSKLDEGVKGFDNVTLIRYGVTKRFEIRLLNQYTVIQDSNRTAGIKPLTISFKNQLCQQNGLLPKITLVSYLRLPLTISPSFSGDHIGYTFTLAARHDLSKKLKIYSNVGVTGDQMSTDISYSSALELNYNVTEFFSVYTEYFGDFARSTDASNGMDVGFIYALKKNISIDLALGSPTLHLGVNRFISFGTSLRLPR